MINIGTGEELSVNELYSTMAAVTGTTAPATLAPPRAGELVRSCLDVERAKMQLGWSSWTTFAEGATTTIASVRANLDA